MSEFKCLLEWDQDRAKHARWLDVPYGFDGEQPEQEDEDEDEDLEPIE